MKAFTITSILAAACLFPSYSPAGAAAENKIQAASMQTAAGIPKQDPQLIKGKLANGLTYFIRPNAEPKGRFSIRLRVNTGSLNETDDIQGVSHFLEHMVFNGSTHFKRGEMIPAMQKEGLGLGGDANAYTAFDETVYMMDVPSMKESTVDLAFTIMRDFADGALLEESAIDAERGIITSEYKVRDSAGYRVMKEVFSIMLDGTRIPDRYPIGTLEVIRTAPREKFINYYRTHYVPSQMQLVIAGDITPEQGKAWVEKYFGSMKKDNYSFQTDRGTLKTATETTAHWITNKEATSTEASINIARPYVNKPDTVANRNKDIPLNVAYAMLNRRLEKMAKNADCPFISAEGGRADIVEAAEVDSIQTQADYKNWKAALAAIEQELRRAIEFGFNKEELAEARSNITAAAENAIKSWATAKSEDLASAIAQSAARDKVFTTPQEDWAISREVVENLTPEQCQAALKEAWTGAFPRVIVTSNKENSQGSAEIMKAYRESQTAKVQPYQADGRKDFSYKFGDPGKVTARTETTDLGVTQLTLSNGVRVNLKPTEFDKDSINITFAVDGGELSRPEKASGLELFANAVMNGGGLKDHSNDELAAIMAGKKVGVGFSMTDRFFLLSGNTNREDLETQLQLQTAYLMHPGYRQDGVTLLRRAIPMIYNKMDHEVQGAMKKQVPAILYRNNPRFTFPTQEQLTSYQVKDVRDWVDAPLKNNYMEVTVTGDFRTEDIIPLLERTVGAVPKRAEAPATLDETLRHPAMADFNFSKDLTYDSSIDKTMVCLFWKTPGGENKKLARRLNMLKAVFYDRVFKGLREDMGETYSPSTGLNISETYPDDGYIITMSSGVMRNKEAVRSAIARIADDLGKGNITQEELDRARNPILNSMDRAQRDNGYWTSLLKDSQARPERLNQQRESIPDVKAITVEEVNKLAKDIFGKGEHLNLNILPDHPAAETPPAEKQADKADSPQAAVSPAAFCVRTTVVKTVNKDSGKNGYAIVISEKTAAMPDWKAVADKLAEKHGGTIVTVKDSVFSRLDTLKKMAPRFMAVVARPEEIDRVLVNDLHRLSRRLDDDPYGDCIWGIVTGYTPQAAMRIASATKPLVISRAMGTTNVDSSRFKDSMSITDWQPFQYLEQHGSKGKVTPAFYTKGLKEQDKGDETTLGVTPKLMEYWKRYSPQLFVTASHATQFNLEMPFGKGLIVSGNNRFYALDKKQFREFTTFLRGVLFNGKEDDLLSFLKRIKAPVIETRPVPAVWVAAGNCLIGDAKKTKNSMAVTALSRYGFNQLVGYTVPSWYGKGGWETLGLLFSNHDASSLAEAWYLNNQFILDETMTRFPKLMDVHFNSPDINGIKDDPDFARGMNSAGYGMGKDQLGLIHDRDTVAFYGDPAWTARLDESRAPSPWHIDWNDPADASKGFTVTANKDAKGRLGVWFPNRINAGKATVIIGGTATPIEKAGLLTNDFLLLRELELKKGEKAVVEMK